LRAVALAAGISRRVYSDTRVIFITNIAIYIALAEKIDRDTPYHLGISFQRFLGEHPQIHPHRFVFVFSPIQKKPQKN
jgi:hypothetical protein